jgi:tetratricopeptide (TPR) repeat protein
LDEAEIRLQRARRTFDSFGDRNRCAQVDDSLARLHLAQGKPAQAYEVINRAVQVMETGDEDAILAEALTTKGVTYCKLNRYSDARRVLEDAHRLASRCGDNEGAGRALLVLVEEMGGLLENEELHRIGERLLELLSASQQSAIQRRLRQCLEMIADLD